MALGCVIRGETCHYDIVAGESARALMDLSVPRAPAARQRHPDRRERRAGLGARARQRDEQGRRRGGGGALACCASSAALAEETAPWRKPRERSGRARLAAVQALYQMESRARA